MSIDFEKVKKEAILKKTKEFISQYGLNDFSMEKLAKFCGLAKGTFYNYFKGKDELITSVIEHSVNEIWEKLTVKLKDCKNGEEKLFALVKLSLEFFNENKDILILYAREIKMLDCVVPNGETMHGKFLISHIERVVSLISQILSEIGIEKNKTKLSFIIHETLVNFNKYYLFYNKEMEIDKDSRFLFNFILNGLEGNR